ncbi:MAG: hypothetical protein RLZZ28_202 [Bacteroidota bacterium]
MAEKISWHWNWLNRISLVLVCVMFLTCLSCSKTGGGSSSGGTATVEEQIAFSLSPNPGSGTMLVLGSTQDFIVTVTSVMPKTGVRATLKLVNDADGSTTFSQTISSSVNPFTVTFQNMAVGVVYTATITVTSASTAANFAKRSFKMAGK